jgi:Uma2 family endonuclease
MTTLTPVRMTEQEYLATWADEQPPWEYDDARAWQKRPMTPREYVLVAEELSAIFRDYQRAHDGLSGRALATDVSDEHRRYRVPDFGYRAPSRPVGPGVFHSPTIAIEIVSPRQSVPMLREKCRFYLEHAVDEAWLIDPAKRTLEVFAGDREACTLAEADTLTSPNLPGSVLSLRDRFASLDELPA